MPEESSVWMRHGCFRAGIADWIVRGNQFFLWLLGGWSDCGGIILPAKKIIGINLYTGEYDVVVTWDKE